MESNKNNEIPPQGLFNSQKEENVDFFSINECYGIIIMVACVCVFNDWNCVSGEQCGPWTPSLSIQESLSL